MTPAEVTITNVKGIVKAILRLVPGVNLLTGRNGAGKTSAMASLTRLAGGDVPLEPRDGAAQGTVDGLGVHLVVRKVTRSTGVAELALAHTAPLGDLIDPGIKDPVAANTARIRALLRLARLPVTDEAIATLADDPEVARVALDECRGACISDLLLAAERVRLVAHRLKREQESAALEALAAAGLAEGEAARALAELGGTETALVAVAPAEAEAREQALAKRLHQDELLCRQRQEQEREQAEIRATLGERPDPRAFDAAAAQAEERLVERDLAVSGLERQIRELEKALGEAKSLATAARAELRAIVTSRTNAQTALAAWERTAAGLDRPLVGPTPDRVAAIRQDLEAARLEVALARASDRYRKSTATAAEKRQVEKAKKERAALLEELAVTVGDRLGQLLSGTAAEGLTVVNGRLHVLEDGAAYDYELRRSDGQRIRQALRVALKAYAGGIVPLDGRHWTALDPAAQAELARTARDLGAIVVTEEPGYGELHQHAVGVICRACEIAAAEPLESEKGAAA